MAKTERHSEQTFMNALLVELCKLPGVRDWRRNAGHVKSESGGFVKLGTAGQADIWGIAYPGIHFEVECKVGDAKLTDRQEAWRLLCEELGAVHVVARWNVENHPSAEFAATFWAGYVDEAIRDHKRFLLARLA